MNPKTGRITKAETPEELHKLQQEHERMLAGDDNAAVLIPAEQLERVEKMNRQQRRQWLAQERNTQRAEATRRCEKNKAKRRRKRKKR